MRLKSLQELDDLSVANYIGLQVWTLAVGDIYRGDKFAVFAIWPTLLCTAVLRTIFFSVCFCLAISLLFGFLGF